MLASGISVSAGCGLRPQVAYPVGPLPMKSLPSGAVSYEETGNIWNSKTGTIRYAIGCRICRNAGGRKSRGCPSLRRMPRENRRRPGADRTGVKSPRFSGAVPDVRFSSGKTGTVANRNGCRRRADHAGIIKSGTQRVPLFYLSFCVRSLIVADVSPVAESKGIAE